VIDTTGFSDEEASAALDVIQKHGEADEAYHFLQYCRRVRDQATLMVKAARAHEKKMSGRAYRAGYRLERRIGREMGFERGRLILAKDDRCLAMDDEERGRYALRG
jgi:hypothetical protein